MKDENHDGGFFNVEGFRKYTLHSIGIEPCVVTDIVVAVEKMEWVHPSLSNLYVCVGRIEVIIYYKNPKSFPIDLMLPEGEVEVMSRKVAHKENSSVPLSLSFSGILLVISMLEHFVRFP